MCYQRGRRRRRRCARRCISDEFFSLSKYSERIKEKKEKKKRKTTTSRVHFLSRSIHFIALHRRRRRRQRQRQLNSRWIVSSSLSLTHIRATTRPEASSILRDSLPGKKTFERKRTRDLLVGKKEGNSFPIESNATKGKWWDKWTTAAHWHCWHL